MSPYSILALLYRNILLFFWSILIESLASYLILSKSTGFLFSLSIDNESWNLSFSWEYVRFNPKKIKIIKKVKYFFYKIWNWVINKVLNLFKINHNFNYNYLWQWIP